MALTKVTEGLISYPYDTADSYLSQTDVRDALSALALTAKLRRQTVLCGSANTNGTPAFLPASATGLVLTTQNVTATNPLIVSAANAAIERLGYATANFSWPALPTSTTSYLYVDVGLNGALTPGSTTLVPTYIYGGSASTTNNQFTFRIRESRGYVGNGSTVTQTYRVYVGEAVTNGTDITSATAYAYNGEYVSAETAIPSVSTFTNFSHNLGLGQYTLNVKLVNTITELGYAVGDFIQDPMIGHNSGGVIAGAPMVGTGNNTCGFLSGATYHVYAFTRNGTLGSFATITTANWRLVVSARRDW